MAGMPLGIELAAGNLYTMPCVQIAEPIEHSIDLLATPVRNIPERHRSLRAVFDYSWHLLTDSKQNTLMRLWEFRGGFTLEGAIEVAGDSKDDLQSLTEFHTAGRYDLHEMLRQFAGEKLVASREQDAVRLRHLDYFCKLAEAAEPELQAAEQLECSVPQVDLRPTQP